MRSLATPVLRRLALFTLTLGTVASLSAATPTVFNVADYGATGRDIATDTAAIQGAIDACSAHGAARLSCPRVPPSRSAPLS